MKYYFLLLICFFLSCSTEPHYLEFQNTSEDFTWQKEDIKSFHFEVDKKADFCILLKLKYLTGLRWDTIHLHYDISGDSNFKPIILNKGINVIDSNNQHIGEPSFDIWTLTDTLKNEITLQKGGYTIKVNHLMKEDLLPYIAKVGIEVKKL